MLKVFGSGAKSEILEVKCGVAPVENRADVLFVLVDFYEALYGGY
jgi:hypothetical protein